MRKREGLPEFCVTHIETHIKTHIETRIETQGLQEFCVGVSGGALPRPAGSNSKKLLGCFYTEILDPALNVPFFGPDESLSAECAFFFWGHSMKRCLPHAKL